MGAPVKPYVLQSLYRRMSSPALRLAAIRGARALGVRHLVVRVDTNDICNLRCPMCPLSDPEHVPAAAPMTVERFERVADQIFPRTRFLYLSCGTEPLATPHFDELLDVTGRLSKLLLELADDNDGVTIARRLTHQQLAQMIGSSRETVSRTLRDLTDRGLIEINRRTMAVRDRGGLQALAGRP